ncbi:MAG TPA: glycosyltransferase family 2 protein [Chthoniobacteraceae bacterium]|jgi:glycosyltransferase involved in cell wall biosynthesis|nr:glycosyltransferase family 2 protein [Chthoniobacteraceae bacterium]
MALADTSQLAVSVLVPAFNEEGAIAETVKKIAEQRTSFRELEVVVINDGSDDRTGEIARTLGVTLLEHEVNRGYGAALKTGLQRAKHDFVLIADADGTYPLEDIPKLVGDMGECDMVVGARTGAVVQVPLLRRPGKWIITQLAEYLSGQKIPDLNSGLRVFRRDVALRFLSLYPDGFSFTTTITLAMLTNHYRVKFVPINYLRRIGKSSIKPIRDFTNFTILIIRICAYFKPLNVFVPPALVLILLGLAKGFIDYTGLFDPLAKGHLGLLAIALALTGIQMLFIGLLADLIDQRMKL